MYEERTSKINQPTGKAFDFEVASVVGDAIIEFVFR
jgi:hypothetical protein